jgi:hypothetical protein
MGQDNLGDEHARTLSGEFWCPIDNKTFDTEAELREHYAAAHPDGDFDGRPRTGPDAGPTTASRT